MDEDKRSILSFIIPRDPSFGLIDGFRLSKVNRNLLSDFEACELERLNQNELMKVYLRLRPMKTSRCILQFKPIIDCVNKYKVTVCPPRIDANDRLPFRGVQRAVHDFTFSQVFGESTDQMTMFEDVALPQVRGFLEGFNSLLFAYGTTSSGKTFTLQGSPMNAGIIPRALYFIFSTIKHNCDLPIAPRDFSDFVHLEPMEAEKIIKEKTALLKLSNGIFDEAYVPVETMSSESDQRGGCAQSLWTNLQNGFTPYVANATIEPKNPEIQVPGIRFSLWISFAEIYNELIYDLLEPTQCGITIAQDAPVNRLRKKPLDLRTDKNGNIFIKGLRFYPVDSAEEAMRLLQVGRQCQNVAATRLNQASSRSHSIMTLKAIRFVDKDNPQCARISSLTFCDLAGSERSEKAATGGQAIRIREACNINTSLLTLGRCMECLRYNQAHPDNPRLVPYRDSKLTRLFQGFFTGRGKACMVVNVSPNPDLFDETLHALRFSALAQRIIVQPNEIVNLDIYPPKCTENNKRDNRPIEHTPPTVVPAHRRPTNVASRDAFSWSVDEVSTIVGSESAVLEVSDSVCTPPRTDDSVTGLMLHDCTKNELVSMAKELSEQLFECKGQLVEQEQRLRREMSDELNKQMVEFEQRYEVAMKLQDKLMEEFSNKRMQTFAERVKERKYRKGFGRKRPCSNDSDESDASVGHVSASTLQRVLSCTSLDEELRKRGAYGQRYGLNTTISKETEERIRDLEGELADQRDLIENMSKERDKLRMEVTRLEFTIVHKQMVNGEKSQAKVELGTQTEGKETRDAFSSTASLKATMASSTDTPPTVTPYTTGGSSSVNFDDSAVVLQLPAARKADAGHGRFFEPCFDSPEQQTRLALTPPTVIKAPVPSAGVVAMTGSAKPKKVDLTSVLSSQLRELRSCVHRAIDQRREGELELCRLQQADEEHTSRMSQGLQSFLENESRIQHMETMEQLRRQIYALEERFTKKHDELLQTDEHLRVVQSEKGDLFKRLTSQTGEIGQLRQEIDRLTGQVESGKAELSKARVKHSQRVAELCAQLETAARPASRSLETAAVQTIVRLIDRISLDKKASTDRQTAAVDGEDNAAAAGDGNHPAALLLFENQPKPRSLRLRRGRKGNRKMNGAPAVLPSSIDSLDEAQSHSDESALQISGKENWKPTDGATPSEDEAKSVDSEPSYPANRRGQRTRSAAKSTDTTERFECTRRRTRSNAPRKLTPLTESVSFRLNSLLPEEPNDAGDNAQAELRTERPVEEQRRRRRGRC